MISFIRIPLYIKSTVQIISFLSVFSIFEAQGQSDSLSSKPKQKKLVFYGDDGFEFNSADKRYRMYLHWRGQFRIAYPTDINPITLDDFQEEHLEMKIRRARMKVGGHFNYSWLNYYLEYELFNSALLDFRIMIEKYHFLKLKIGQWKVHYNRERIISSGKQQTVERSILTRPFTVDRQMGMSVYGNFAGPEKDRLNYWVSAFMGTGRGEAENDDANLMYMMRLQWNVLGEPIQFSGSDLENHEEFSLLIAIAGVTNRSPYTRFSQDGGGELEGYEVGLPSQYRVNQFMIETAFKYKGLSWQQEFHWKQIDDKINLVTNNLSGNLIQAGYFPAYAIPKLPKKLEIYARQAFYIPNTASKINKQTEFSFGANWFFNEHKNKLTAEIAFINANFDNQEVNDGTRYRLQWDVSF